MGKNDFIVGADIGGSHISSAIVSSSERDLVEGSKFHSLVDKDAGSKEILDVWAKCLKKSINSSRVKVGGVALAIPGPFDYENGISKINGVGKYDSLLGVNIRLALFDRLNEYIDSPLDITFINDANAFILGEVWKNRWDSDRVIGLTLGTGFGSGFIENGIVVNQGEKVPKNGELYCQEYKGGMAEDYVSTRWFTSTWKSETGKDVAGVKEIAEQYETNPISVSLFNQFGENLANNLNPWIEKFKPTKIILGGNIVKAIDLFSKSFEENAIASLPEYKCNFETENSSILGACQHFLTSVKKDLTTTRETAQILLPIENHKKNNNSYDLYPSHKIDTSVEVGYSTLAAELKDFNTLFIDGYQGVNWNAFANNLFSAFKKINREIVLVDVSSALKEEEEIMKLIEGSLGGDDPIFGRLYEGSIEDFFDQNKLEIIKNNINKNTIVYGVGASLLRQKKEKLVYVDLPKNEIQFRSRSGVQVNIGEAKNLSPKQQYKRMYFIDWVVLNSLKEQLLPEIDYIIDEQRLETITWLDGNAFRDALTNISSNAFRVRPWFEPGAWGGQWIKDKIPGLAEDVPNYAWSFELIVPENGLIIEGAKRMLEVSFDFLMFHNKHNVLGEASSRFQNEFPIRFDFLDTINGGNLSVQCHPRPEYMKEHFGHNFTQDETYYMLDADESAKVFLGFQEGVTKEQFGEALNYSQNNAVDINIEDYVQSHPAKKHDLFLIPNGTIHASASGGMVLEISSTPYIFTFKMYDWMRLDLDGKPRPINIDRGLDNLYFERQGDSVKDELISKQTISSKGDGYQIVNLSTHPNHFYAVDRLEFDKEIEIELNNQCHVLSLVEGESIKVVTNGLEMDINYAETFVVPAASSNYKIINTGGSRAKVIKAFVKSEAC